VLVAAADVGRHIFEDYPVFTFPITERELGEVYALDFHHARPHVRDAAIGRHELSLLP
jgi:hypothetical protein